MHLIFIYALLAYFSTLWAKNILDEVLGEKTETYNTLMIPCMLNSQKLLHSYEHAQIEFYCHQGIMHYVYANTLIVFKISDQLNIDCNLSETYFECKTAEKSLAFECQKSHLSVTIENSQEKIHIDPSYCREIGMKTFRLIFNRTETDLISSLIIDDISEITDILDTLNMLLNKMDLYLTNISHLDSFFRATIQRSHKMISKNNEMKYLNETEYFQLNDEYVIRNTLYLLANSTTLGKFILNSHDNIYQCLNVFNKLYRCMIDIQNNFEPSSADFYIKTNDTQNDLRILPFSKKSILIENTEIDGIIIKVDPFTLIKNIIDDKRLFCNFEESYTNMARIIDWDTVLCLFPNNFPHQNQIAIAEYIEMDYVAMINIIVSQINNQETTCRNLQGYLYFLSPINPLIISTPFNQTDDTDSLLSTSITIAVFRLDGYSSALITMDFRFIDPENSQFVYGVDWEIAITVDPTLTLGTDSKPSSVPLPENFLDSNYDKFQVHEFILTAFQDFNFKVDFILLKREHLNSKYLFVNSTSVKIISPYRANYGTPTSFYALIQSSDGINLPINIPDMYPNPSQPGYYIDLGSIRGDKKLSRHSIVTLKNYFNPVSIFYDSKDQFVATPYLPYFSNCKGFDKHIPIFSLFEQNADCILYPPEQTEPISPFSFGQKPVSDICSNIELTCIYDEIINQEEAVPRWFEQGPTTLFLLTQHPQPASTMTDPDFNQDSTNFIEVEVSGDFPTGKTASKITLKIDYFQYTKTDKQLISASVTFSDYIDINQSQATGAVPVYYTLVVNFNPLEHTDLLIKFAFSLSVYMVLFLGIGIFAVIYILFILGYHFIFSRIKKAFQFKFGHLKFYLKDATYGIFLGLMPMIPFALLLNILGVGYVMDTPVFSCEKDDSTCWRTPFDGFTIPTLGLDDLSSSSFQSLRNGRTGFATIVSGFVSLFLITKEFAIEKDDLGCGKGIFADGNVWSPNLWNRTAILFYVIIQSLFSVLLLQFAFGDSFSANYILIFFSVKIFNVLIEMILTKIINDKLIVSGIVSTQGMVESLITFGSSDFLNFLFAFMVDVSSQVIERLYLSVTLEYLFDIFQEKFSTFVSYFYIKDEESDSDKSTDEEQEEQQDESDGNIILIDVSDTSDSSADASIQQDEDYESIDSIEDETIDDYELIIKKRIIKKEKEAEIKEKKPKAIKKNPNEDRADMTDEYLGFSLDTQKLIFTPFFTFFLRMFYDVNSIGPNFSILKENFYFYVLFAIFIIPFQLIIDLVFYNIMKLYHDFDYFQFLKEVKVNFENRKNDWVAFDDFKQELPQELRSIYLFGYSSQFYFIITIFSFSSILIVIGIQTIVAANYDIFNDPAAIFIGIIFWLIILMIYHGSLKLAKKLRIWSVRRKGDASKHSRKVKKGSLFRVESLHEIDPFHKKTGMDDTTIEGFERIEMQRELTDIVSKILRDYENSNLVSDPEFREKFVKTKAKWLLANIEEIFTARTIKEKRQVLINSFNVINRQPLQPRTHYDYKPKIESQKPQAHDIKKRREEKKKMPLSAQKLLHIWHGRAIMILKMRSEVAGIIEAKTKDKCEFCGKNYMLRAELVSDMEAIFIGYYKESGKLWSLSKDHGRHIGTEKWQDYFRKHAKTRTLCFDCNEKILQRHLLQIERSIEEKRRQKEDPLKTKSDDDTVRTQTVRRYKKSSTGLLANSNNAPTVRNETKLANKLKIELPANLRKVTFGSFSTIHEVDKEKEGEKMKRLGVDVILRHWLDEAKNNLFKDHYITVTEL